VPGARIAGPALIVEDETTTVVAPNFEVTVNAVGYLVLEHTQGRQQEQSR
jgi:N-methylhydantoinase A